MSDKLLSMRPDRSALFRFLEMYLRRAGESRQVLGLVVVRLKGTRQVNTSLGYRTGDVLLALFADRVQEIMRHQDRITRIGDQEFALILPGLINEGQTVLAANKLLRILEEPFEIEDALLHVGAVMGIAVFPTDADTPEHLLQRAEVALADAQTNEAPFSLYSSLGKKTDTAWDIESELETALELSELEIYYQPKINLRGGLIVGAEALIRWNSPTRGLVPPSVFIPIAAQTGQIRAVTWSALNMALQQQTEWPTRFGPLTVAVNLSPTILEDIDLVGRVSDAMGIWGTKPNRLTLEITESAVMRDPRKSFHTIRQLKEQGVMVSIDDFGTGYSSLANFKNIPASELKIDNSFVGNMMTNAGDEHIVRSVIALAHGFGLEVVAEGVHNREILERLIELRCNYAQGFYIGRPVAQKDFINLIRNYRPLDMHA